MNLLFATDFKNDIGVNIPLHHQRLQTLTLGTSNVTINTQGIYTSIIQLEALQDVQFQYKSKDLTKHDEGYLCINVECGIKALPDTAELYLFGVRVKQGKLPNGKQLNLTTLQLNVLIDLEGNVTFYNKGRYVGVFSGASPYISIVATDKLGITIEFTSYAVYLSETMVPQQVTISKVPITEQSNEGFSFSGNSLLESLDKNNPLDEAPNASVYKIGSKVELNTTSKDTLYVECAGNVEGEADTTLTINAVPVTPKLTEQSPYDTIILGATKNISVALEAVPAKSN